MNTALTMSIKQDSMIVLLMKIAIMMVCGQFTFATYPTVIVLGSAFAIAALFFISLYTGNYFSFIVQLFICNHFMFGYESGGVFNILAFIALIAYLGFYRSDFNPQSSAGPVVSFLLVLLVIIHGLSVLNSDTGLGLKISAMLIFCILLFLFYYAGKIDIGPEDFTRLIQVTGLFMFYSFAASLNQKFEFFRSPFYFFPSLSDASEYEYGILRSIGTFGNFEFYAEYSFGIIALLIPGILTGSVFRYNIRFGYFSAVVLLVSLLGIFLSGTRSSLLLLPVLLIITMVIVGKRLNIRLITIGVIVLGSLFLVNQQLDLIDLDVFSKRSQGVDLNNLTFAKIASGEEMNRGPIFAYGAKKASESSLFYGEGYFTKRNEYVKVHFDNFADETIPDYHNLYMSAIVIWGYLGAVILVSLLLVSLIRGFMLYLKLSYLNYFLIDLMLGFSLLFFFLIINQFKIEFIRDANYFMLTLILLSFYNSLISVLSRKFVIVRQP